MTSVCLTQNNYQPQQQHHFQLMNGNIMLCPTQQQQLQLQQQSQTQQQQYMNSRPQPIAPAKVLGNSNLQNIQANSSSNLGPMLSKKKYTYMNVPYGEQLPSVARRNARERNRVKQVNNGFSNLRQHLPQTVISALSHGGRGASKKLSKVDTLRIAVEYIRSMQDMLEDSSNPRNSTHSVAAHSDESSNDGSNYAYSSAGSPVDAAQYQMRYHHSEESASPTPSYTDSDISVGASNFLSETTQQQQQLQQQASVMQFKFEPFDNYSPISNDDEQADDDEELLDYISSWQDQ